MRVNLDVLHLRLLTEHVQRGLLQGLDVVLNLGLPAVPVADSDGVKLVSEPIPGLPFMLRKVSRSYHLISQRLIQLLRIIMRVEERFY